MSSNLSRRQFLVQAGTALAAGILAACRAAPVPTPQVVKETVVVKEEVPKLVTPTPDPAIRGELTIDMQYIPGKVTADTPRPLYEILRIAEEYESMHPGVTVKFVEPFRPTAAMPQIQYFQAGAAAGTLPDISFAYGISLAYHTGVWLPTTDFLEEPNPYIPSGRPGRERWRDQYMEDILPKPEPDGHTYTIPHGWGGPGPVIGYNKEMFEEIGITALPKDYYDYFYVCEQVLDAGIVPVESSLMTWMWDDMVDYLIRAMGVFELIDVNEDGRCDLVENTRAAVAGLVSPDAPYWVEPTRIWKAATRYYQPGFLALAAVTGAIGRGEIFLTEQSAMLWEPPWSRMMAMGGSDKWGVFLRPRLTNRLTPWAEEDPGRLIARGAATQTITRTCEDRGHTRMAVDWLKFVTNPSNSARLLEERMDFSLVIPTIKDLNVALAEDVLALLNAYEEPHAPRGFQIDQIGDWHFWYEYWSALQAYFAGGMTLKEMTQHQVDALPRFIDNFVKDEGLHEKYEEWLKLRDTYTPPPWGEYDIPEEPFVMPFNL
jgi:ABC-type glycerol-3-phosphate transport system substrate-binding protein